MKPSPCAALLHRLILACLLGLLPLGAAAQDDSPPAPLPAAEGTIAVAGENPPSDAAIEARLREIFANLELMDGIQVSVNAGVVVLEGELVTQAAHLEAVQLARQVEGVVGVEDRLENVSNPRTRLGYLLDQFLVQSGRLINMLPLLAVAAFAALAFWIAGGLLTRWDAGFRRLSRNPFMADLLKSVTRGLFGVLGVFAAMEILDATALFGAMVGVAGVIGLSLSFALRDTVENYVATILLSLRQPFAPKDVIALNGIEGTVICLTAGATLLMDYNGNHLRIPNGLVYKSTLLNYTRNPQRRFGFEVQVDGASDVPAACLIAVKALKDTAGVLARPEPLCQVKDLGDGVVVLEVFAWTDQSRFDFGKVRGACILEIRQAFETAGIDLAAPLQRLQLDAAQEDGQQVLSAADRLLKTGRQDVAHYLKDVEKVMDVSRDRTLDRRIQREASQYREGRPPPREGELRLAGDQGKG